MNATAGANPFIDPRPFEPGEKLYGRDREIAELVDRLNSERILLLHSPSGTGKSSLIQAGLRPELRGSFDVWGPTRLNQEPPSDDGNGGGVNRYVASANLGFEEEFRRRFAGPPRPSPARPWRSTSQADRGAGARRATC